MQRNEIEQIANRILIDFNIISSPYSFIKTICDAQQIQIKKTSFTSQMDGAFAVLQGQRFLFYNPEMPDGRKNFTKAHELGHFFLDHQLNGSASFLCSAQYVSERSNQTIPRIETEANLFAAFFLMPEQMMRAEFRTIAGIFRIDTTRPLYVDRQPCNKNNWDLISRHFVQRFGVSKEALGYRLDTLGLIQYRWNG